MKTKKKKAKAKKHKPDWPQMFADRIIDVENRVTAIERAMAGTNAAVPVPGDVVMSQETAVPSGE